ncbi:MULTISPECIES: tricarballylate utilization 4Fe-4S protein TcuB [unclassified Acidovorax]|uniref:tricarballylate utilization 4Fe-4S protein TcuB n=1 Tax=unclassified Acidovorax TaxID=2684926 RepID=UPI000BD9133F|nr:MULTISPECIES: tricarballylate utilization 4Fe-4S protein TcuB [unclassified Acidovorax]OZA56735.1 MAG: tricarballylate utilization protein B [Acidovorax sp. 17-64-282]HQS19898.1 tricarballylate utilization 4Fe-4S protein TcuB [Acidovorax defluvii]OYY30026.1 MAG: tricarballylate utilization protein B [Acidovorax sp. 35-64-16]OYY87269.1 MAG: tricarballylate utilization protein B [Acidovorax sp. 28-64-14]OYZ45550.1 MAG: tricarballylate utilization protein B [Acidovorax sp. 16-64-162]
MQSLEALTRDARALANGDVVPAAPLTGAESEVARQMQICNACRYCEGFCAVFPAMTRRLEFGKADIHFLANLCHNCGACLHACQYAPPHEFAVNVPQAMAQVRGQTYADYAWPPALGALYQRQGLTLSLALAAGLALFLVLGAMLQGGGLDAMWGANLGANFYNLFPHNLLVGLFAPVFLFVVFALAMGVRRFWRDVTPATSGAPLSAPATFEATDAVLRLKYLDGGHGDGCHNEDDAYTLSRRRFHHLTFYGFMLCFAATSLATVYHYVFGWAAPYDLPSVPKLLGAVGGVMLMLGTAGLWHLNRTRHALHGDAQQKPMDLGFIALLFLVSSSGLALWLARSTPALALLLCLHLGAVMALFATLPYGKFAHGIFRTASLLRHAIEKRQPNPIGLGAD